jgi:hypothetical protein
MPASLWIFIDGLGYEDAVANTRLKELRSSPVTPGIGFSNNLYPEMLCGTNPDEIGYFNEWSPVEMPRERRVPFFHWLDAFRGMLYVNAGLRKILLRKVFGMDAANIPFRYLHLFAPQGSHDFRDLGDGSLLSEHHFHIVDSVEHRGRPGPRDIRALDEMDATLEHRNTFLSLVDYDNLQHIFGVGSPETRAHLEIVLERTARLAERFVGYDSENTVYLFSDHGMAPVSSVVDLAVEKQLGPMDPSSYLYFIDSTMIRFWVRDPQLAPSIRDFLSSLEHGEILSERERAAAGVTSPDFGDFIFRAHEGVMYAPNFFGARPAKAMHGYDPELPLQQAFFGEIAGRTDASLPRASKEIHGFFEALMVGSP